MTELWKNNKETAWHATKRKKESTTKGRRPSNHDIMVDPTVSLKSDCTFSSRSARHVFGTMADACCVYKTQGGFALPWLVAFHRVRVIDYIVERVSQ